MTSFSLFKRKWTKRACCGGILPRALYVTFQAVLTKEGYAAALREKKRKGAGKKARSGAADPPGCRKDEDNNFVPLVSRDVSKIIFKKSSNKMEFNPYTRK
jgi:hypothetical protein